MANELKIVNFYYFIISMEMNFLIFQFEKSIIFIMSIFFPYYYGFSKSFWLVNNSNHFYFNFLIVYLRLISIKFSFMISTSLNLTPLSFTELIMFIYFYSTFIRRISLDFLNLHYLFFE
jgi:hypothetical protein